jgi:hypothetical protein
MRVGLYAALGMLALTSVAGADEAKLRIQVRRAAGPIIVDGDLSDAGWEGAAVIDTFYETLFGDNRPPTVKTTALLTYDDKYFYVGLRCEDPKPDRIRAPYVDRDNVIGTDDNVAVFLDTRNDRRSAQEFRVNPRGIQGDAIFNDANGNEDFSPDFYYDAAARITAEGWTAELRIPFSTLRYQRADAQSWGIIIWRNYPREFRYAIYSSPIPRGSNCLICHSAELTGLSDLPAAGHLVAAPYVSGESVARASEVGGPLQTEPAKGRIGGDLKWTPSVNTAVDLTANPDFSQVEADLAQIAVNQRFALFYPEKRPFFLEGTDLLDTPIQAVYTRTITSPGWGARTTGSVAGATYTLLLARDQGGGSVILPGPTSSSLAPQDFESVVGVARVRKDLKGSFFGFLYTGREIDGGGHNRVFGPDFMWRVNPEDRITGQLLFAETKEPSRPDLASEWDGRDLSSHALHLSWTRNAPHVDWLLRYADYGDGFRADEGFVPQVGFREERRGFGYTFFPKGGFFNRIHPFVDIDHYDDRAGAPINQRINPGIDFAGRRNLQAELNLFVDRVRTSDQLLARTQFGYVITVDPAHRVSRIGLQGFFGEDIDIAGVRVGRGGNVTLTGTVKPTDHLALDLNSAVAWLNVDDPTGRSSRLFTAQVQRLKATYNASARLFLRLIGQYVTTLSDPSLYTMPSLSRSGSFAGSALLSYRLNWQTACFLGYGDDRVLDGLQNLVRMDRQFFVKLSYAFQR